MICRPIGNPPRVKPHGTLIAGMPNTLNGSVLRISEGSRAGFASTASIVSGSVMHVGATSTSTSANTSAIVLRAMVHAAALLDIDLRRDARTAHDALQRQRLVQRALRGVGEQRRVIRVRLGVEQRVGVGRGDRARRASGP